MIIKYHPDKIYDKNKDSNKLRRMVQLKIDRHYTHYPLLSKASELLLNFPGFKRIMKRLLYKAHQIESKVFGNLLENKEEQ